MNYKSTKILVSVLALSTTVFFASSVNVSAYDGGAREGSLVQRLMERFGLNQNDVDNVVNEYRQERQNEMQQKHQERVNELVQAGVLSKEQANALEEKRAEWQNNKPDYSSMSHEERQAARDSHRSQMQEWAQSQGIDMQNLQMGERFGGGKGRR